MKHAKKSPSSTALSVSKNLQLTFIVVVLGATVLANIGFVATMTTLSSNLSWDFWFNQSTVSIFQMLLLGIGYVSARRGSTVQRLFIATMWAAIGMALWGLLSAVSHYMISLYARNADAMLPGWVGHPYGEMAPMAVALIVLITMQYVVPRVRE